MSASGEWGTRLTAPVLDGESIDLFRAAFLKMREQAADTALELEARRARIAANIRPPAGYFFAHSLGPNSIVTMMTIQLNAARHLTVKRDVIDVTPWHDKWVLGDRLYFPFDARGDEHPDTAKLSIVDTAGNTPRHALSVRLGELGLYMGDVQVFDGSLPYLDSLAVDPAELVAAGMEQYGLTENQPYLARQAVAAEPRGRQSE